MDDSNFFNFKLNLSNLSNGIVGINIGTNKDSKNTIEDYCYCLEKLGTQGHYITINISSPNTPGLRDLQWQFHPRSGV